MKFKSLIRVLPGAFPVVLAAMVGSAAAGPKIIKAPQEAKPVEISAHYSISLNGFDLGELQFKAESGADTYRAVSDVSVSALLGAFKWHGVTNTSGRVAQSALKPQDYRFEYDGTARSGSVQMRFDGKSVTDLTVEPVNLTAPDTVALERQHLSGVLDPLSAIMALTRIEGAGSCAKKLSIFDGKQRFDLNLSFRRQEPIGEGEVELVTVCQVKYIPIAGYRANDDTRALAANNGIEIAFRAVPAARLMVPHKVVVPTLAGDAVLKAERISISSPGRDKIALVND